MREQGGTFEVIGYVVPQKSITAFDLVLGTTYEFKVEARNEIGYSSASEIYSILHALAPEQPSAPTSENSGTDVLISWTAPGERGSAIASYIISIKQKDGQYSAELTSCDGSLQSIVDAAQCSVPITSLVAEPFLLERGDSVFAVVVATNPIGGDSVQSEAGNGATIISAPDAPLNLAEDSALRTISTLGLTWSDGASDGGAPILDYRVSMAIQG